jgi:hypothetical protein
MNEAKCVEIVLRMTPEQRTYVLEKIRNHLPLADRMRAEQIFGMAALRSYQPPYNAA